MLCAWGWAKPQKVRERELGELSFIVLGGCSKCEKPVHSKCAELLGLK